MFANSPFQDSSNLTLVSADAEIIFVADMFVEDYVGGAELTTQALIDSSPFNVQKIKSRDVTMSLLEDGVEKYWIFGNYSSLDINLIPSIVGNLDYSVLEYDYKYCKWRSPEKCTSIEQVPCTCETSEKGKMISAFMYGAKSILVLTSKEKDYIDNKDAEFGINSYDESITYGTGDTKFHYICPRFWCLNDENGKQRSITLKEINEGKCGGWDALIPRTSKKIPPGGRIYEFTDQRFHRERYQMDDTNNILVYKPMYPGFQEKTKHPNNLCIPCCFGRPRDLSQKPSMQVGRLKRKIKNFISKIKRRHRNKNTVPRQA